MNFFWRFTANIFHKNSVASQCIEEKKTRDKDPDKMSRWKCVNLSCPSECLVTTFNDNYQFFNEFVIINRRNPFTWLIYVPCNFTISTMFSMFIFVFCITFDFVFIFSIISWNFYLTTKIKNKINYEFFYIDLICICVITSKCFRLEYNHWSEIKIHLFKNFIK